jgi:hypothetical protein
MSLSPPGRAAARAQLCPATVPDQLAGTGKWPARVPVPWQPQPAGTHASDDPAAPIRPLRLDLLQTFVVVAAEESGLGAAARRLYLTPSGVSRRLHALEAQVGTQLFNRAERSMPLTAAGQRLLPEAMACLAAARRALGSAEISQEWPGRDRDASTEVPAAPAVDGAAAPCSCRRERA